MSKNILWICTDSQRVDTLGCYGNTIVSTPNIDALAKNGVKFNLAFAVNPLCTPNRGNFLTGRYPITNKLRQNGQCINDSEVTVVKILRDEGGYTCGLSGKLHLSACDYRLKRFGKEFWRHPQEEYFDGVEMRIDDGYSDFYWDHAANPLHESSSYIKWLKEQGIEYVNQPFSESDSHYLFTGMPVEYHQTTYCFNKAADFITEHSTDEKPWLFSLNVFDPHYVFNPPAEYMDKYRKIIDSIPLPDYVEGELDNKPRAQYENHQKFKDITDEEHRWHKAAYLAQCELIDDKVGEILKVLTETGQIDNTIIIFTSDHGELLGDHGMYIKGPYMYDVSLQVPLIISCPGVILTDTVSDAMIELGDLAPTILDAAGIAIPENMQAKSFWNLLTGNSDINYHRDNVYAEYLHSNPTKEKQYRIMVRDKEWKIVTSNNDVGELYDLTTDPGENNNLWDNESASRIKTGMLLKVVNRLTETCDPMPERIGVY